MGFQAVITYSMLLLNIKFELDPARSCRGYAQLEDDGSAVNVLQTTRHERLRLTPSSSLWEWLRKLRYQS